MYSSENIPSEGPSLTSFLLVVLLLVVLLYYLITILYFPFLEIVTVDRLYNVVCLLCLWPGGTSGTGKHCRTAPCLSLWHQDGAQ